jgi:hypothetical protein
MLFEKWPISTGITGRFTPDSLAVLNRITQILSHGSMVGEKTAIIYASVLDNQNFLILAYYQRPTSRP